MKKIVSCLILILLLIFNSTGALATPVTINDLRQYLSKPIIGDLDLSYTWFVYGDISNIDDQQSLPHSVRELSKLEYIVTTPPGKLSEYAKLVTDTIKDTAKLFGYVNLGPNNPYDPRNNWISANIDQIKLEIDQIADAGWYGVFIDQYGYDFGETRERQNAIVDYAHSKGLKCFVNAWHVDDALGDNTHLTQGDWYLCESFLSSYAGYRANSDYMHKYIKAVDYSNSTGINIAGLAYQSHNATASEVDNEIKMSNILAKTLGFHGWCFGKDALVSNDLIFEQPDINIGDNIISYLHQEKDNKYIAQTDRYSVYFYAGDNPAMLLTPLNANDSVITIGDTAHQDKIDIVSLSRGQIKLLQHRINDYGFKDSNARTPSEDGYIGSSTEKAIDNYLQANGYSYFSQAAWDALIGNTAINYHGDIGTINRHTKPEVVVKADSIDEQMLLKQYRDRISIIHFDENQFCDPDSDRYSTNARYKQYLAKFNLLPYSN